MGYATWTISGEVVPHVREAKIDTTEGTITLSCSALNWNIETGDDDPRDEIARFQALSSQYINNEPLLNGGTKLQVGNGQIITVTDGTDTYTKCALEPVQIQEDHKSTKRIDYELIIHYELSGSGGSYVYTPDYEEYSNIDYYFWYKPSTGEKAKWDGEVAGTEIGHMTITEAKNVRRVEVYGGGDCVGDNCYIECNGDRRYWHYGEQSNGNFPQLEKLTWDLDTPANTIVLNTDEHWEDMLGGRNYGCYLAWVRVIFASG
jgi:hypothetical protein